MFDVAGGFKLIPAWAAHYVFAGLIWCGIHYLYITPVLYDRMTLALENDFSTNGLNYNRFHFFDDVSESEIRHYAECIYSTYFYKNRTPLTLWTASLGLYSEDISQEDSEEHISELRKSGECGEYPLYQEEKE